MLVIISKHLPQSTAARPTIESAIVVAKYHTNIADSNSTKLLAFDLPFHSTFMATIEPIKCTAVTTASSGTYWRANVKTTIPAVDTSL